MLSVYKSRNFKALVNHYIKITAATGRSLFAKQVVVVPNMVIGRWLKQCLAAHAGISANLDPVLPASYSWGLMRQVIADLPERSDFDAQVMQLSIFKALQDIVFTRDFPRLHHYLAQCTEADAMVLAGKVSRIFDHYQVYRGDWLKNWENRESGEALLGLGEDEVWQQALWMRLNKATTHGYRSKLEETLLAAIETQKTKLPQKIFVFGVANLPSNFIKILNALSVNCEVHLFAFSAQEGGDIPAEVKHWHQTGYEFYEQLNSPDIGLEAAPSTQGVLTNLQNFLVGKKSEFVGTGKQKLLTVNCFSAMREVEALHDYLLQLFTENPQLVAGDVLVALPDLENYSPFIRAVFDADDSKIPYVINGSLTAVESPLINGLTALLEIPRWRFTREQVMVLARNRLIKMRFNLSDDDLDKIDHWLDDSGVRWGIDAAHRADLGLPKSAEHTWRAGLDRILLGAVLPKKMDADLPLFRGVLPVDELEGGLTIVLSQFVSFCEKLFSWREALKEAYSLDKWRENIQGLLSDFFIVDELEEQTELQLLGVLDELTNHAEQSKLTEKLSNNSFQVLLSDRISTTQRAGRMAGVVTFSSMNNLAGVPFKHVCLLGMNYDAWPTQQREPGFDLLQNQPSAGRRCGDRSRGNDERYLTLQLIMSAQDGLYMSYVGRNIHNGEPIPPSVMVSELLDCCNRAGESCSGLKITEYQHGMHVYSAGNFTPETMLQSHDEHWVQVARKVGRGQKTLPPLFTQALENTEAVSQIDVDELCSFFTNPQNSFLRHALGITLRDDSNEWNNVEPFGLANFTDGAVRSIVLTQTRAGRAETSMIMARASGILPHGLHGEVLHEIEQKAVDKLLGGAAAEFNEPTLEPITVDLHVSGINIIGVLRELRPQGQLLLLSDNLYPYQKIQLWLKHLLLCCVNPPGIRCTTKILSLGGMLVFDPIEDAQSRLAGWLRAYCGGLTKPLPFFAKVSFAYAETVENDQNSALSEAQAMWEDGFIYEGVGSKPANQFLYRGHCPLDTHFETLAQELILPIIKAGRADHE